MLKEERQQHILELLRLRGRVLASELSLTLDVSEDTVRRDLNELAEARLIQRVHGGALLRSPNVESHHVREHQSAQAKAHIAQTALQFFQDGQVIIMDGGTTTLEIARRLPAELRATIITNSVPVAMLLGEHPHIEVNLIGGKLYKTSLVTVGADTVASFGMVHADLCLLGICSLHPEIGITTPQLDESQVKRAMIANAAQTIALAATEKLNTVAPYVVGPLRRLTYLVTEPGVPAEILAPYSELGITIVQE